MFIVSSTINMFQILIGSLANLFLFVANLGLFLLNDHARGRFFFQDLIKDYLVEDEIEMETFCDMIFANLPPDTEITNNDRKLVTIRGTLISRTDVMEYAKAGCYQCTNLECVKFHQRQYVTNLPPFLNQGTDPDRELDIKKAGFSGIFKCAFCEIGVEEIEKCRMMGKYVVGVVAGEKPEVVVFRGNKKPSALLPSFKGKSHLFSEDLDNLAIGRMYEIIGDSSTHWHSKGGSATVECMMVKPYLHPVANWRRFHNSEIQLSSDFYLLYSSCSESSPWSFGLSLVYEFASEVCPKETFFKLKLAILLSLLSVSTDEDDFILPLMVVSFDSLIPDRLLRYAAEYLAEKSSICNVASNLMPKINDATAGGKTVKMIEAGSILGSSGGVCYLGELQGYKPDQLHELKRVLESGKIPMPKDCGKINDQRLESALWCYCSLPLTKNVHSFSGQKRIFKSTFNYLIE